MFGVTRVVAREKDDFNLPPPRWPLRGMTYDQRVDYSFIRSYLHVHDGAAHACWSSL